MIAADNGFMQTGDGLREVAAPTIFDEADACIFEFSSNQPGSSLPVTRFAASALVEVLAWWLEGGDTVSAEEAAGLLDRLVFVPVINPPR